MNVTFAGSPAVVEILLDSQGAPEFELGDRYVSGCLDS